MVSQAVVKHIQCSGIRITGVSFHMRCQISSSAFKKYLKVVYHFLTFVKDTSREYSLRVSYMEIYNEKIHDLLSDNTNNLEVHEDPVVWRLYIG